MTDPLAEVLRSVRLTGGLFLDAYFSDPWCVLSEIRPVDTRHFLNPPMQLVGYHYVISGRMLAQVAGGAPIEVNAGEIVLLPRNEPHLLGTALGERAIPGHELVQPSPEGGLMRARHGGGDTETHIVCGFLGSEESYNPLIATLPPLLKLDVREAASRGLIEASMHFAAGELAAGRMGTSDVMSRLSELLIVEAVRSYAATQKEDETGWLKGVADPQIGKVLALMHDRIDAPWSAEALAAEAAMSRSAFLDRFTRTVGMPPMRFLTNWRLQTARRYLRETRKSVAQLAHAVGYESEEAFSRAFKREFGMAPAHWREQRAD
jgi:AraC-like DNA-binding protein